MSMLNSQFLVRRQDNKLAIGLFFAEDPEDLADMIDEFCDYDALEFKALETPINFLFGDFTIPTPEWFKEAEDTGNEDTWTDKEKKEITEKGKFEPSYSYYEEIDPEDDEGWLEVPTHNTFFSRLTESRDKE